MNKEMVGIILAGLGLISLGGALLKLRGHKEAVRYYQRAPDLVLAIWFSAVLGIILLIAAGLVIFNLIKT